MSTKEDESLYDACAKGHLRNVQEILEKDSDIINRLNQRIGYRDHTPLHAATSGCHVDILQLLLNYGGNVNAVNKNGDTLLHYAGSCC
jgi:ankyrin repeat protein